MKRLPSLTLLRFACLLTLVSLGLIIWGILHPRPLPVIFAMSVGQGLGTIAVLLYGIVVLRDLRPRLRSRRIPEAPRSLAPPSGGGSMPPPSLNPGPPSEDDDETDARG